MKVNLNVNLELPFIEKDKWKKLKKIGNYSKKGSKFIWDIPLEKLPEAVKILNKYIELNKSQVKLAILYCPPLVQEIQSQSWKGKSGLSIIEFPKYYKIIEYRKSKETGEVKRLTKIVSKEIVQSVWNVIQKYPIGEWIKTRKVARDYCVYSRITKFIVNSRFDFQKFFGSRSDYFSFYYSLKILEEHGVIEYHSTGKIRRLTESWAQIPKNKTFV